MNARGNSWQRVALWFNLVWPPLWLLGMLLVAWVLANLIYVANGLTLGNWEQLRPCLYPRDVVLIGTAAAYGLYRGMAFHPVLHDSYFEWLTSTPWTRQHPLPLGPIHLVPQDALLVALLAALGAFQPAMLPVVLPLTFLATYAAGSTLAQTYTGPTWTVYLLLFGLIAAVRATIIAPWLGLCVAAFLAALLYFMQRLALADFPWTERLARIRAHLPPSDVSSRTGGKPRRAAGDSPLRETKWLWPLNRLHVDARPPLFAKTDFVRLSLLGGLCVYSLAAGIPDHPDKRDAVRLFCWLLPCGFAAIRLVDYVKVHHPPLGLLGRWATGQWIIPAYDVVFLTPIATIVTGIALHAGLDRLQALPEVTLGVTIAAASMVTLLGGPDRRTWQLTCPCRIVHFGAERRSVEQI
jgi:hypothetical protein